MFAFISKIIPRYPYEIFMINKLYDQQTLKYRKNMKKIK